MANRQAHNDDRARERLQKRLKPFFEQYHRVAARRAIMVAGVTIAISILFVVVPVQMNSVFLGVFIIVTWLNGWWILVVQNGRFASENHMACHKCEGMLFPMLGRGGGRQIEDKFPGWVANESVPLRCPNCGAYVEEYLDPQFKRELEAEDRSKA